MVGKQGLRAFVQSKKANEESRIVGMDIFKATSTEQIWRKLKVVIVLGTGHSGFKAMEFSSGEPSMFPSWNCTM